MEYESQDWREGWLDFPHPKQTDSLYLALPGRGRVKAVAREAVQETSGLGQAFRSPCSQAKRRRSISETVRFGCLQFDCRGSRRLGQHRLQRVQTSFNRKSTDPKQKFVISLMPSLSTQPVFLSQSLSHCAVNFPQIP